MPLGVREMRLALVKGEAFQESFGHFMIVKVRKYRIKMASVARKSPTDVAGAACVLRPRISNGEIFQERGGGDQKCRISPNCALR